MINFNRQELIDALEILQNGKLDHNEINNLSDEDLIWKIITIAYYFKDKSEGNLEIKLY
jgi:hypothetical protein